MFGETQCTLEERIEVYLCQAGIDPEIISFNYPTLAAAQRTGMDLSAMQLRTALYTSLWTDVPICPIPSIILCRHKSISHFPWD